jgi:hypothetical protein
MIRGDGQVMYLQRWQNDLCTGYVIEHSGISIGIMRAVPLKLHCAHRMIFRYARVCMSASRANNEIMFFIAMCPRESGRDS